jgi:TonB family protein
MSRLQVTFALPCAVALQAAAQGVDPASPAPGAPVRAAAAATPAPNPRVLLEAANPMRIILEASKIRRKPGEGDALTTALPAAGSAAPRRASVRAVATQPSALPAGIVETVTPLSPVSPESPVSTAGTGTSVAPVAAAVPVDQPVMPPVLAAVPSSAQASLPPPVQAALPTVAPTAVAPTPSLQPPQAAPVAALTAPSQAFPTGSPASPPPAAPATEVPSPGARPRIVSMVAPEFPAGVLRRVGSFGEITVQITINHDGSVGNVSVPSAAYRALEPYVVEALQRWRFEAPGEPRSQRLQLVFNN